MTKVSGRNVDLEIPFDVTLTQDMCSFSACVTLDGGAECGTGCVANNGALTLPLSVMGFMLTCSGTFDSSSRTGAFTCPLGALGSCAATLRAGLTNCN